MADRNIFHDILVYVRRQDSSYKDVRLGDAWQNPYCLCCLAVYLIYIYIYIDDEFCEFLRRNFPEYKERMVTVPVSFQYKEMQGVQTHGIVRNDGGRKNDEVTREENDWQKAVSGLRAEQRIFDEIQSHFSDQPCLLMNGFSEHDLIKVMKSKLQKKGKCDALSNEVNTKF